MKQDKLQVVPLELKLANLFVKYHHRHHAPAVGHRFSIGCVAKGILRGVAIVGRPVARMLDQATTLEVTRLCTDGTPNACSCLYGAAARIGKQMGYAKIQTYILEYEDGTSLKAAGWVCEGERGGGSWARYNRLDRRTDQPMCVKHLYSRELGTVENWTVPNEVLYQKDIGQQEFDFGQAEID